MPIFEPQLDPTECGAQFVGYLSIIPAEGKVPLKANHVEDWEQ